MNESTYILQYEEVDEMFYLKQYNNTLLKFDIVTDNLDGQKILSLTTADGFDERKMPIGVNANPESVMKWL